MRKIYAISDGGFTEDKKIDQKLVSLLKKDKPKILFLPLPLELPSYPIQSLHQFVDRFHHRYRDELNCETEVLYTRDSPSEQKIREKVLSSDAIYMGPGHGPTMMQKIKEFHMESLLKEAYQKGIVMAGMSAGAMCWFQPNLGFIPHEFYPHYQGYENIQDGFGANEHTAALFLDEHLAQIVKTDPYANIYGFKVENGKTIRTQYNLAEFQNQNPGR